jgi:uncharacterized protein (TIGR02996 family)
VTDGDALLAAILAHPGEDTPRLMYADWLDENGEPARAEFIRVQVAIARPGCYACQFRAEVLPNSSPAAAPRSCRCPADKRALPGRERELLEEHRGALVPVVAGLDVEPCLNPDTRYPVEDGRATGLPVRGLCERLRITASDWLTHADAILARHPVRRVRITDEIAVEINVEDEQFRVRTARMYRVFTKHRNPRAYDDLRKLRPKRAAGPAQALGVIWPGVEFELPRLWGEDMPPENAAGSFGVVITPPTESAPSSTGS